MFDFDGKVGGSSRVDLSGRKTGARQATQESRSDFVKRQHQEREARERKRIREAASRQIQALYRGHRCRRLQGAEKREVFDKRYAGISKVSGALPAPQKAKFVFQLLVPMLRLLVFFFRKAVDQDRLSAMLELVLFSGTAADNCNFLRIFLMDESSMPKDATRTGCLSLLENFFSALLTSSRDADALKLLKSLQQALFSPGPDYKPLDAMSGAVVARLLRRTNLFQVLPALCHPGGILQAADVVLLMTSGLEAISCDTVEASLRSRQELLAMLLSASNLVESLCEAGSHPTAAQCLARLCCLLVHTAGVLSPTDQERSSPATLVNIATLLERFALRREADPAELLALLSWLSWSKALCGDDTQPLLRLHRASFVRTLLAAIGRARDDVLLAVCRLYFAPFEPSFRIAAAVLSSKILGPVLAFTGSSLGFMPSEVSYMQPGTWRMSQDSNWIVDVGVHFAAALRLTLGDVEVVQALHRRIRPELQPFDSFAALLRAPSDAIGTWIFSLSVPKPRPREIPGLSDLTLEISGANGTVAVSRGHVELRDRFGHPVAQLRPEAPSVAFALRRAAKGVVGEVAEDVKPEEALKDLQLVEAVLSHHERLEL